MVKKELKMKCLIVGAGAREHAILRQLNHHKQAGDQFFCAPSNAGIEAESLAQSVSFAATDVQELAKWAKDNAIDLTIVGPEVPLALGIVDQFEQLGLCILGPNQNLAQLESSKVFAKEFMERHHIRTASYALFKDSDYADARLYIRQQPHPLVIKADGLAAGKGVVVSESIKQSEDTLKDYFHTRTLGDAASQIVIESFIAGEEASLIAVVDVSPDHVGYVAFPFCQDHKRVGEGDMGANTGGMGAYAPVPHLSRFYETAIKDVIEASLNALKAEGKTYRGFLFCGLMIDSAGVIHVLEYNVRLGDPETCVLLPLVTDVGVNLRDVFWRAAQGKLTEKLCVEPKRFALGTVLASKGYPEKAQSLAAFELKQSQQTDTWWCHAGTSKAEERFSHKGGRVACAVSLADSLQTAQANSLALIRQNATDGLIYRADIGFRAIAADKGRKALNDGLL
jgi:phosphoribosylamine--glycine ligase